MQEKQMLSKVSQERNTISADTFRRICLLNIVDGFRVGSYGAKRLHKIAYIAERDREQIKPFEFKRYIFGQYSETLDMIKDQLISMGYIAVVPLDTVKTMYLELSNGKSVEFTTGGNMYVITNRALMDLYRDALAHICSSFQTAIFQAIRDYGSLQEDELVARCYDFPEFVKTEPDQTIFDSNLPEQIEVPDLSIDDCDELELSLNPRFIPAMAKIIEGLEQSKIDFDRIEVIDKSL